MSMARRKTQKTLKELDSVTQYANKVLSGELIAGPDIRHACQRHLSDLKDGEKRKIYFDVEASEKAIGFFRDILRLNGGKYEGKPFELLLWQKFIVGSLFGWKNKDGSRRFRRAYVESGKGSGKSPLAAGIGLIGLTADGEPRAEIYAAATKKDQAMILFRDAVAMVDQSWALSKMLKKSGVGSNVWSLEYRLNGSFFRAISSDKGQSGPRPHISLIDEIHEHKTNEVVEMMTAGQKSRTQPLVLMITNSGVGRETPCWAYHEYGAKVARGDVLDDEFFVYICSLDEDDDPFENEECWYKSNPSLQESDLPSMRYLRGQVKEASGMPSKEAIVRRLNFCQWTGAVNPWISLDIWKKASREYDLESLKGRRAWGGLDLSSTTDLTGLVFLVEPKNQGEAYELISFSWLPEDALDKKEKEDSVPYRQWLKMGFLETTAGRAISKRHIAQRLSDLAGVLDIQVVAYDRWRMADLISLAEDSDIKLPKLEPFGQGFQSISPAIEKFETMLLNDEIVHNNNSVMNWCINNAITIEDAAGNRKLAKNKAKGRMDLVVCAVMAAGVLEIKKQEDRIGILI